MDTGVEKLLTMIRSIEAIDSGSKEKKLYELAQFKSSVIHFGIPMIYLTFNPRENNSPIVLLCIGKNIDIESFSS